MPKRSAGLLMYRRTADGLEVFLVHPGGRIGRRRMRARGGIPKGEYGKQEEPLAAAETRVHRGDRVHGEGGRSLSLGGSSRRAERLLPRGPWKAIVILPNW